MYSMMYVHAWCALYAVTFTYELCSQDRAIIAALYEEWLSAGEDWQQSAIVCNAQRDLKQRKRGKFILQDVKTLRNRFGNALARQLRDEKKALEDSKSPKDNTVYWMKHPDFPQVEAWTSRCCHHCSEMHMRIDSTLMNTKLLWSV